ASRLGLTAVLDRPYGTLSTGQARRTLLAATLIGEPSVLVLDEPTLGLDPAARADLRGFLRGVARDGTTVLLSTHLLEDVEEVCDRVLFLKDGRLVGDEPVGRGADPAAGPRTVDLGFASDVPDAALAALATERVTVRRTSPRSASVTFEGGRSAQA
ncbi:ATP-binding protein of ABC transporter, partial [mine drainage metagenome]